MIHHVRGVLVEKAPERLVVEVGGLGLELHVSDQTWRDLGPPGEIVHVLTHLAVREDGWTLFGFAREEERALFRLLLGVQGVGPRMALAVLSGLCAESVQRAVREGDVDALTTIAGVGKKIAQRVIIDLRDKVGELPGGEGILPVGVGRGGPDGDEAVDALVALGYPRPVARVAVQGARAREAEATVEDIVKDALRLI